MRRRGWRVIWQAATAPGSDPRRRERRLLAWTLLLFLGGTSVLTAAFGLLFAWAFTGGRDGVLWVACQVLIWAGKAFLVAMVVCAAMLAWCRRGYTEDK